MLVLPRRNRVGGNIHVVALPPPLGSRWADQPVVRNRGGSWEKHA